MKEIWLNGSKQVCGMSTLRLGGVIEMWMRWFSTHHIPSVKLIFNKVWRLKDEVGVLAAPESNLQEFTADIQRKS